MKHRLVRETKFETNLPKRMSVRVMFWRTVMVWVVVESTMETLQNFFQSRYAAVESDFSDERQVIHPQSQE